MLKITSGQMCVFDADARVKNIKHVRAAIEGAVSDDERAIVPPEMWEEAATRAVDLAPALKLDRMDDYIALGALVFAVGQWWESFLVHPSVVAAMEADNITGTERLAQMLDTAKAALLPDGAGDAATEGQN